MIFPAAPSAIIDKRKAHYFTSLCRIPATFLLVFAEPVLPHSISNANVFFFLVLTAGGIKHNSSALRPQGIYASL